MNRRRGRPEELLDIGLRRLAEDALKPWLCSLGSVDQAIDMVKRSLPLAA